MGYEHWQFVLYWWQYGNGSLVLTIILLILMPKNCIASVTVKTNLLAHIYKTFERKAVTAKFIKRVFDALSSHPLMLKVSYK
jgi:hypothetical protein